MIGMQIMTHPNMSSRMIVIATDMEEVAVVDMKEEVEDKAEDEAEDMEDAVEDAVGVEVEEVMKEILLAIVRTWMKEL